MKGKNQSLHSIATTTYQPEQFWRKKRRRRESIKGTFDTSTLTARKKLEKLKKQFS